MRRRNEKYSLAFSDRKKQFLKPVLRYPMWAWNN